MNKEDFDRFDKENPHVYALFERFALEAASAGALVGAKAIWERMRWHTSVKTKGDGSYQLNNTLVSWYVRKFKSAHPRHGKLFRVRKSKADADASTPSVEFDGSGQGFIKGVF